MAMFRKHSPWFNKPETEYIHQWNVWNEENGTHRCQYPPTPVVTFGSVNVEGDEGGSSDGHPTGDWRNQGPIIALGGQWTVYFVLQCRCSRVAVYTVANFAQREKRDIGFTSSNNRFQIKRHTWGTSCSVMRSSCELCRTICFYGLKQVCCPKSYFLLKNRSSSWSDHRDQEKKTDLRSFAVTHCGFNPNRVNFFPQHR